MSFHFGLTFWLIFLMACALVKARCQFNTYGDGSHKVSYSELENIFRRVFWRTLWQFVLVRCLVFVATVYIQSVSPPPAELARFIFSFFFSDVLLINQLIQPVLDNFSVAIENIILMTAALASSFLLSALTVIAAFLITLNYGRNRYLRNIEYSNDNSSTHNLP